jgi:catechol 2,3-dioxygenase-like lactoylglutathione lyase family enzyme
MGNTTLGVSGTDFVCVPVTDIDRARDFYEGTLGLEFGKQWGEMPGLEYETGNLTIALMQSDAFGLEFAPHSHPIALHVDDVAAARSELESEGIEFPRDTLDSGVCHMAFFTDPFGNGLMLHHRYAAKDAKPSAEDLDRVSAATEGEGS